MSRDVERYEQNVFQQGNITCYASAKFFPRRCRDGVFKLYSFMLEIDRLTDAKTQQPKVFKQLVAEWDKAKGDANFVCKPDSADTLQQRTVKNLVSLARDWHVESDWIDTYMATRKMDFDASMRFKTFDDTLAYIEGTGETLAVIMCQVMGLTPIITPAARLEARGMQYLNFVRDIAAYNALGRCYIPEEELAAFGLTDTTKATATANPEAFKACLRRQVERSNAWILLPKEDYIYLPKDCRVSLVTAVEMYEWTAATITQDPFIVFDHQVKPTKHRALVAGLAHLLNM